LRAQIRRWFDGVRQAEAPFRQSGGFTIRPDIAGNEPTALSGRRKGFAAGCGYCFASGAANTCLQAAGNCASVIGGRGFGGTFGGFGWRTESLNQ
jgi:hypothetical protein